MATMYELKGAWLTVYSMADDPDADLDTISDTLEAIEGEIEDKADGYACVINQLVADAKAIKAEEDRLFSRRKSIEMSVARMKESLRDAMELTGKTKFKTARFSFGIQNNPASVVLDEQYIENIPPEYLVLQDPTVNKKKIAEDLKAGKNLDGIAHLAQTQSLRIR